MPKYAAHRLQGEGGAPDLDYTGRVTGMMESGHGFS
jgi:hypothetical protein